MIYSFREFELDDAQYRLARGGRPIKLEPKVFDVLRHLVVNRDRVVTKDELLEALWPGEFVSESAVPRAVTAARRALDDDRAKQQVIRTVHGRGYQFVARVRVREGAEAAPRPNSEGQRGEVLVGREDSLRRLRGRLDEARSG